MTFSAGSCVGGDEADEGEVELTFKGIGTVFVPEGTTIKLPPNPKKNFYKFEGWYSNNKLTKKFTSNTVITKDMTIYPKFTPKTYTVTFKANGGKIKQKRKNVKEATKKVTYSSKLGSLPIPTKEDYSFQGWYTRKKSGIKVTKTTVLRKAGATYYARWTKKKK